MKKPWIALRRRLEEAGLLEAVRGPTDNETFDIDHLAHDSRKVGPAGLFVAIRGEKTDGHLFIDKAVKNETIAVVCEVMPEGASTRFPGVTFARVDDTRNALAALASAFYDDPAREMSLIGVTGTNGKTTTAYLLRHVCESLSGKTGLLGTIKNLYGAHAEQSTLTTPDALDLHRMLRDMVEEGCGCCVMEVSSHALAQSRVGFVDFDVAVFTNLTHDHLGFHGTPGAYQAAKKQLFDGLGPRASAVINADDPAASSMVASTSARTISYGQSGDADIPFRVLTDTLGALRLRLDGMERDFRLRGCFNAYNLAAAYAAALAWGLPAEGALNALTTAPPAPGRFEQLRFEDDTVAIVDYAHTPDALGEALKAIRRCAPQGAALWCVFGCGGDRDAAKRPLMGAIAERLADQVIVTSDNARTENPARIYEDIRRGMNRPEKARWIDDRREAIRAAARHAAPGDVVLVAGKGHEAFQSSAHGRRPFDDRQEIQEAFAARGRMRRTPFSNDPPLRSCSTT